MNDNSSATVMLGLEGMTVLAVSERDGELEYAIETTSTTGWCPVCGAVARLHDRRPTWVRDLPAGDGRDRAESSCRCNTVVSEVVPVAY